MLLFRCWGAHHNLAVMATTSTSPTTPAGTLPQRRLGATGPVVATPGLGLMGMSDVYGRSNRDEGTADTGDFYGMGANEELVRDALRGRRREDVVLSVKYGALRDPAGSFVGIDTRPAATRNFLAYTLQRLGTDYVDVYRPARLDPAVPIEETMGGLAELVQAGWVRHIGLSEVGSRTLRRAVAVHPVCDLQVDYSLASRGIEDGLLATCRDVGVGVTAYGVLSRGLLSGHWSPERAADGDFRAHSPRFQAGNVERNLQLVEALREVADDMGATVAQLAIAWVTAQGEDVGPVLGARRPAQLAETLAAADLVLDTTALARVERAFPRGAAAGDRYDAASTAALDSERG